MQVNQVTPSVQPTHEPLKPVTSTHAFIKDGLSSAAKPTNSFDIFVQKLWNLIKQIFCCGESSESQQMRELTAEIEKFFDAASIDETLKKPTAQEVKDAFNKLSTPAQCKIREFLRVYLKEPTDQNVEAAFDQANHVDLNQAIANGLRALRGCSSF